MKGFFKKLGTHIAATMVMALLVFAPFQTLVAQALTTSDPSFTTPITQPTASFGATPTIGAATQTGTAGITTNTGSGTITPSNTGQVTAQNTAQSSVGASNQPSTDILANCRLTNISGCVAAAVYVFTIGIGSAFAYVAAYFFDVTIQLSLNSASYGLDFISTSWTTARDLGNMAFLFILLFIAFQIILRADTSGTMSLLAGVIMVALLVNFSFFFSRVAIDAGNILAIQFYNAIPAPPISQTIQGTPVTGIVASATQSAGAYFGGPSGTKDLTASIMNMIQVQNLLNNQSFSSANPSGTFNLIATIFVFIAAAIVLWLLTVAFITNGVKFLMRVVVLWFLIIVSPFAFVAAAVQGPGGYFKQWRDMLINHAFYPVAFMFIFLILNNFAITVSGGNNSLVTGVFSTVQSGGSNSWGAIGASLVSVAIRLGLVIAVLFVGMKASDRISVVGSKYAEKAGGWAGGMYKNTFSWAGGAAYRNTGGRAAAAIDNSVKNSRWANTPGTIGGSLGYRLRKNVLAPAKKTSLGTVASSYDERQKYLKERKGEMGENIRARDNADAVKGATEKIAAGSALTNDEKNTIQRISKKEFETMKSADIKAIASVLTEDQIKKVGDIEKIAEKDREEIKAAWEEKSEDSPYLKAKKKLEAIAREIPAAATEIADHKVRTTGSRLVDSAWAVKLKTTLQTNDRDKTDHYDEMREELKVVKRAHTAAPTAANLALLTTARANVTAAHTEKQKAKEALDNFKDFDDNRKKVDANKTLNNNGVKGTFHANLLP